MKTTKLLTTLAGISLAATLMISCSEDPDDLCGDLAAGGLDLKKECQASSSSNGDGGAASSSSGGAAGASSSSSSLDISGDLYCIVENFRAETATCLAFDGPSEAAEAYCYATMAAQEAEDSEEYGYADISSKLANSCGEYAGGEQSIRGSAGYGCVMEYYDYSIGYRTACMTVSEPGNTEISKCSLNGIGYYVGLTDMHNADYYTIESCEGFPYGWSDALGDDTFKSKGCLIWYSEENNNCIDVFNESQCEHKFKASEEYGAERYEMVETCDDYGRG